MPRIGLQIGVTNVHQVIARLLSVLGYGQRGKRREGPHAITIAKSVLSAARIQVVLFQRDLLNRYHPHASHALTPLATSQPRGLKGLQHEYARLSPYGRCKRGHLNVSIGLEQAVGSTVVSA
jgi:hypothetical protein